MGLFIRPENGSKPAKIRDTKRFLRCVRDATFFRTLDRAIYLIIVQLRIVRVLTAFCSSCLRLEP
jgi:hypothetical protein